MTSYDLCCASNVLPCCGGSLAVTPIETQRCQVVKLTGVVGAKTEQNRGGKYVVI